MSDSAKELGFEVAVEFVKLVFKDGGINSRLKSGHKKTMRAAEITANRWSPRVESYMKLNAPWTDQTGNARNGLAARPYRDKNEIGIILFHQVDYGVYLETRWSGRYAIINPTIEYMSPRIMDDLENLMDRL